MAARIRTIGTGITRRKQVLHDGSSLIAELKRQDEAVKAAGWYAAAVARPIAECERIVAEAGGFDADHERDSEADFASAILIYHRHALQFIADGNADQAAEFAFNVGTRWAAAVMKWSWEKEALTGERVRAAAAEGHRAVYGSNDQKNARWRAIAADVDAEIARGTKKTAAYALVAEKHKVSEKTVQRAVKKS